MADNKYLGKTGLSELVTLFKNDLSKKQRIVQYNEMPEASKSVGRVVQYVGHSDDVFKKGLFYYSTGIAWEEIAGASFVNVDKLPAWEEADRNAIYLVLQKDGVTVLPFVKSDKPDKFYEFGGVNFNTVRNAPLINGMSLVNEDDPSKPKSIELRVKVQQYPDSDTYDEKAAYPASPEEVRVNKLALKSLTDAEIKRTFEEA